MVEVLNFMGYFVKYWNKNDFTILTTLDFNLFIWAIVVHSSCYNKIPETGWPINNRKISYSSGGWEVEDQGGSSSSVWWWPISHFLHCHLPAVSSQGRRDKGALWGLFYKDSNFIYECSTLSAPHLSSIPMSWSPSKASPPGTNNNLEVGFQ